MLGMDRTPFTGLAQLFCIVTRSTILDITGGGIRCKHGLCDSAQVLGYVLKRVQRPCQQGAGHRDGEHPAGQRVAEAEHEWEQEHVPRGPALCTPLRKATSPSVGRQRKIRVAKGKKARLH